MTDSCAICGHSEFESLSAFKPLFRVTSDCRPWKTGGELRRCRTCNALSKPKTGQFLSEIDEIYGGYNVYYQGGGLEQMVKDPVSGLPKRRSEILSLHLKRSEILHDQGKIMDIGCGNGTFLEAFGQNYPDFTLFGSEIDDRNHQKLQRLAKFAELQTGGLNKLKGRFDLISLIHCLEHLENPLESLQTLHRHLNPGGVIFLQLPSFLENPFDLIIADHIYHFTPWHIEALLKRAGFAVISLSCNWISKEISVLARQQVGGPDSFAAISSIPHKGDKGLSLSERPLEWLLKTLDLAKKASETRPFGLFGTSIAAAWLSQALPGRIDVLLDEDEARQNKTLWNIPVKSPEDVDKNTHVFIGLAPKIATSIGEKLKQNGFSVEIPPPIFEGDMV